LVCHPEHTPAGVSTDHRADFSNPDRPCVNLTEHGDEVIDITGLTVHDRQLLNRASSPYMIASPGKSLATGPYLCSFLDSAT